jgi:hypothetical protein
MFNERKRKSHSEPDKLNSNNPADDESTTSKTPNPTKLPRKQLPLTNESDVVATVAPASLQTTNRRNDSVSPLSYGYLLFYQHKEKDFLSNKRIVRLMSRK